MTDINFNIDSWLALSPGLITQNDWINWSKKSRQWPDELVDAPVNLIKPMMRRRMSSLSKLALQTALQISQDEKIDYIVFSSRHGEMTRTVKLIQDILVGEDASPTAFSQSVHNTAAGLFTISENRAVPVTSIAAVESTLHHAFIEAAIYLKEYPLNLVLIVDFDEPLPEPYKKYESDNPYQGYAFSALLSTGNDFQLSWCKNSVQTPPPSCQSLSIIEFLLQEKNKTTIYDHRLSWSWLRS
ncbi:beta-ketoacyl synthase chain length factor [Psychromonas sp.]|nr:beta-ketoacyl synthase chain length factor [Psychromonas sp.]